MMHKESKYLCVVYKFDNQWGAGQSLRDEDFGESHEYFLDDYVLYNGSLNEKQTELVYKLLNGDFI